MSLFRKKKKVLVADDDPHIGVILKAALSGEGYEVDVATDGEDTVRMGRANGYDVVLLDLYMPGRSGIEVLESWGPAGVLKKTKVLMTTGESKGDFIQKAHELGAAGYIVKPFDPQTLLQKIRDL